MKGSDGVRGKEVNRDVGQHKLCQKYTFCRGNSFPCTAACYCSNWPAADPERQSCEHHTSTHHTSTHHTSTHHTLDTATEMNQLKLVVKRPL